MRVHWHTCRIQPSKLPIKASKAPTSPIPVPQDERGEDTYPVVDKSQNHKVIGTILDYSSILNAGRQEPAHIRRIYITTKAKAKAKKALSRFNKVIEAREKRKQGECT